MCRDEDILGLTRQSLNILSNIVAVGVIHSNGIYDEIVADVLGFIGSLITLKTVEVNDLILKVKTLHLLDGRFMLFDTISLWFYALL